MYLKFSLKINLTSCYQLYIFLVSNFTHLQLNLATLRLRGPMQRMHEVGALFFLYAFPFPSIFRTPLP